MKSLFSVLLRFLKNNKLFKVSKLCFKLAGFSKSDKLHRFYQCILISIISYSTFGEFMFAFNHYEDIFIAAQAIAPFAAGCLGIVKAATLIYSTEKFHHLMKKLEKLEGVINELQKFLIVHHYKSQFLRCRKKS